MEDHFCHAPLRKLANAAYKGSRMIVNCSLLVVFMCDSFLSASKVFPQSRHKNIHIDRLCDMIVHSGIQCHLSIFGKGICRHSDDGDICFLGVVQPTYFSCRIVAVHHRHLDVHKDQLIRSVHSFFQHIHTFHSVFCAVYRTAFFLQQLGGDLRIEVVVLGQQNPCTAQALLIRRVCFSFRLCFILGRNAASIEDVLAPGAEKLMCSTRQEMMEAVRNGKADAAFVYYYMAQAFVNSDTTGTMTYTLLEQPTFSYRMVVSSTENHALAGILTKAMYAMPDNLVEDLATQYTTYKATNLTLADMIRLHPVTVVAIIVFISWMAVAMIIIVNRLRTRRKLQLAAQQKAKEMAVLAEQAQAASKAKSTFLSNMSHDIRTPMNAIIGFTNIALHQDSVSEMHNCLKKIEESSDHLLSLLNDVLDLSRIESGKVEFSPVPTNITAVTDSVIEIVKGMLLNRELNFEVHREPLQNPYVMTEPVRIREILVNILNNAVKFTKDGGTIRFDAGNRPGADAQHIVICYRIKDTGIGMSEDFQKKIFDEFAQEENGVRTQYKGTGLGMPISKKYIELMGGTITVDSRKGVGTTFTVEIPMELTNAEKVEKTKPLVQHNDLKGIKVLLAEDNDLNAELATILLEDLGMTVTRAADGQEVVDLFAEHPAGTYDIILMDIMMPKMDGHQAAKEIRAMYADRPDAEEIPIIALSANAFSEDVQASLDAGMNGHVSKPLNMEEVTKVIERNLNRP